MTLTEKENSAQQRAQLQEKEKTHNAQKLIQAPQPLLTYILQVLQEEQIQVEQTSPIQRTPWWQAQPLAILTLVPPHLFATTWQKITTGRQWCRSVEFSRLASLRAFVKRHSEMIRSSQDLVAQMSLLMSTAHSCRVPSWTPAQDEKYITTDQSDILSFPLYKLTWILAQRLGDMLRLRCSQIFQVTLQDQQGMAIIFVRGKCVGKHGPFTIHIPYNSTAATILRFYVKEATAKNWAYVFLPSLQILPDTEEDELMRKTETATKRDHPISDFRALRRGGVIAAATNSNLTSAGLRTMTRHADDHVLRIYLGAGLLDRQTRDEQFRFIEATENALSERKTASVLHFKVDE